MLPGYDLSRLMAGSLGVLGLLLEVSLKVAPIPVGQMTLVREQSIDDALLLMRRWARRSLPITATAWVNGRSYVRICGSEEGLAETHRVVEGLPLPDADTFLARSARTSTPVFYRRRSAVAFVRAASNPGCDLRRQTIC